ncbi:MAG: hypothetical protein CW691_07240 [Candidatus Bathyarchaeum sp.]|nr:MAG: hypothetical protein CW691_07240 [Candidatus Bathyarchaeum sp.]
MGRAFRKRKNSGQTLIITALVIALLILSVVYGVFEAGRRNETRSAKTLNTHVLATKLGLKNTLTSALVNVTNGGENQVLTTNINEYVSFVGNQSYFGKCTVLFTECDVSPYESGMWISWGSDGKGVSSAYANFTLTVTGTDSEIQMEHTTNITTSITVDGTYIALGETNKQVNITCNVLNEGEPALAQNITAYYEYDGDPSDQNWITVDSPTVTDYGKGSYTLSFVATTQTIGDPVLVSTHIYDIRDVFVLANVTCTET